MATKTKKDSDAESVDFYNVNLGLTGRPAGGPWLDDMEARDVEKRRAFAEKRQPDLDNPPPHVGTQLVTKPELILHSRELAPSEVTVDPVLSVPVPDPANAEGVAVDLQGNPNGDQLSDSAPAEDTK